MKFALSVISSALLVQLVAAPPPRRNEPETKADESKEKAVEDFGLEYNRYLKEVIDLLESDPEFKRKLEDAQEADIRSGQIARELEFVDHRVRNKLDEAKRQEIERLRHLAQKQYELTNGIETEHVKVSSEHLDHENPHTFEMEDLKKLIAKVSADLSAADEKRHQEFKEYEMQKEFEKQQKLKHLEGSEREEFEKQLKENETKHKQHEPLHHPGSKQQLEEVWEKQDHMDNQEFDPKIFFQLHDLDGNGFWDQTEVKTLFLKELDKMYETKAPEDDMKERAEEMERMREHVFSEADKNKDGLISYEEFIEKTKQPDFEKDPGWESIDQKPVFTQEEYQEFEKRRLEEVQRLIQQGVIPPQPVFHPAPGYHPQMQYFQYQYQTHGNGHPQPPPGQHQPVRYAQDFPSPAQQHGYQQQAGHHQGYPNPAAGNQHYQGMQQPHHQQEYQRGQNQNRQHVKQDLQQANQQGYHQPQANQQGYHQPQANQQGYQQAQANQQGYQQAQANLNQQGSQPQAHPNQGYQPPQAQPNQQGYQQGYQQTPQAHPNQPASYQQVQAQQGYQRPQQNQADAGSQQPSHAYEPGHDPNEVRPDPKYQKDTGNAHPNVIDLQHKKSDHQSKSDQ